MKRYNFRSFDEFIDSRLSMPGVLFTPGIGICVDTGRLWIADLYTRTKDREKAVSRFRDMFPETDMILGIGNNQEDIEAPGIRFRTTEDHGITYIELYVNYAVLDMIQHKAHTADTSVEKEKQV